MANLAAGLVYIVWRYAASINPSALTLSIFLLAAETYGFVDAVLYALTMWKPRRRVAPPPLEGRSVDVFITTYNESEGIVRLTAEAAMAIDWSPLSVYILDDGARAEIRALAEELGCGYITRGEEWKGRARHAKAGNVNNALNETDGEFILILDADQIPELRILSRLSGYFADPRMAFVQSPQSFYNLLPGDPFGSDAALFYGPIMRGKDGWNAAFFCGSNALLRREALMQVGLLSYAEAAEREVRASLRELRRRTRPSLRDDVGQRAWKKTARKAVHEAWAGLRRGEALQAVSDALDEALRSAPGTEGSAKTMRGFLDRDIARSREAVAVEGVSTVSVTEDMATALRLHASGWNSAFHPEVLAHGLAPEDLGSSLAQRLRWAQGTIQVLFRDSPLAKKGLRPGQRLMYFATINSYFSGFANLVFVLCPLVFLFFGVAPIKAWDLDFFLRFIPFFVLNRLMFVVAAEGLPVHRGEQYNLGLFPLWIRAVLGVVTGREIRFTVTPKTRQSGRFLSSVKVQIGVIALTLAGLAYAAAGLALGTRGNLLGIAVNAFWGCYNVYELAAIVRAAVYTPPEGWEPQPPRPARDQGA
jgi:cellulose synthase (UDP-forming)